MESRIFSNSSHSIKYFLLQIVLLAAVFSFTGYNDSVEHSFKKSNTTELVKSERYTLEFELRSVTENVGKPIKFFYSPEKVWSFRKLANYEQKICVFFKSSLEKRIAVLDHLSIQKIRFALPSSDDENFLYC